MTKIEQTDIDAVCGLVDDLCGICWDESKSYLIEARLQQLVQDQGCDNYKALVNKVRAEVVPGLKEQVIDAVTTNETLWFRDSSPFEAMQYKLIPEIIDQKAGTVFPNRLRIWSAACSTGQEVYSIAMTLKQAIPDIQKWDIQILGTDISPSAVEHAKQGVYNSMEISRGMNAEHLKRYFTEQGDTWRVTDELRTMCSFHQRNLHEPFNAMGTFDIIFCRNVAIYFGEQERLSLFERLAETLTPNGWIMVGSSESLINLGPRWQPQQHCRASCYHPNMPRTVMV